MALLNSKNYSEVNLMSKNLQPEIRFKGFSDNWSEKKLGEIGYTFTSLNGKKKEDFGHGSAKYITYMNVFLHTLTSNKMLEPIEEDCKQNSVCKGDVFFTTSSETPHEVGMSSVWIYDYKNIYLNSFCFGFRPTEMMDLSYLAYMLRSESVRSQIIFLAQGISRYNISKTSMMDISLVFASGMEQKKIGDFFQSIDKDIALQEEKLNKTKNLKKAMLEKMFPKEGSKQPEVRFDGFSGDWDLFLLGDKVEFFSGLTYSPNDIVNRDGTLVLRSSNVQNGEVSLDDNVYVNNEVVNSLNVEVGDVVVVVRNGSRNLIGKHALIKYGMKHTVIGAFMTGVRYETPYFLNALLDTQKFIIEINKSLGATINQITLGNFKQMSFFFPSIEEQKKVGEYFRKLDDAIALQSEQLNKLKNIKKAYLAKMFV